MIDIREMIASAAGFTGWGELQYSPTASIVGGYPISGRTIAALSEKSDRRIRKIIKELSGE